MVKKTRVLMGVMKMGLVGSLSAESMADERDEEGFIPLFNGVDLTGENQSSHVLTEAWQSSHNHDGLD